MRTVGAGWRRLFKVWLDKRAAFAYEWGAAARWVELEGVGVDDGVSPAAFVDLDVVEQAEKIEIVFGGRPPSM